MLPAISGTKTLGRATLNLVRFASRVSLMKRTRSATKVRSAEKHNDGSDAVNVEARNEDGDEKMLQNLNGVKRIDYSNQQKSKINLQVLKDRNKAMKDELKPNVSPPKNKPRAVVDLKMMTEELKQLEDPPMTAWEKEICSNRLPYSFYDCPCEQLAQNLLGKILVRCLENGTILKGRIVETEGYLGTVDKASHTYQNKVTPRNIPMYMPPGTIYVYMTYGMYHCFNISSQESGAYVSIKAVEPMLGLDYMELLRNMQTGKDRKEKRLVKNVKHFKVYELCNSPAKICTAFVIEEESFDQRKIYECSDLWIERDPYIKSTTIVAANPDGSDNRKEKVLRYYVLGSSSVSRKDIEFEAEAYNIT